MTRLGARYNCIVILIRSVLCCVFSLSTETVDGSSLSLQGVDNIERGDGLSLGMSGVGDRVSDDVFHKDLEDTSCFFVDKTRDTLDSSTTGKTTDSRFGDTLYSINKRKCVLDMGCQTSKVVQYQI